MTTVTMHCGFYYQHAPHEYCPGAISSYPPQFWPVMQCPGWPIATVDSDTMTEPYLQCPCCGALVRARMAPPPETT